MRYKMTNDEIITVVCDELKIELAKDATFDEELLLAKVKAAAREVKSIRNYPKTYSDEMIARDMEKYISNIRKIALYDYNQIGIEFQTSSSENSESRSFVNRNSLFYGIIPLSRV